MKRLLLASSIALAATATAMVPRATDDPAVEDALAKEVKGRIVQVKPVEKDCMVLSYIPDWDHGEVDNIGLANNDGGVRTLLDWPKIPAADATKSDRKFLLATYSRKTNSKPSPGVIQAYEIETDWPERTSWKTQPRTATKPAAKVDFIDGDGWKLFDVSALVRDQAKEKRTGFGVLLRFQREDRAGAADDWSGYAFVSREGDAEWKSRRPLLLVVEPAK
jgi:hypothetical protein